MTDFRFDLKAVRVKRVLAMFMAVCLTVLSVNVDVFATNPASVSRVNSYGHGGGKGIYKLVVATGLDAKDNTKGIEKTTVIGDKTYVSPYTGDLKVTVATDLDGFVKFDKTSFEVSVLNGRVNEELPVTVQPNTTQEERESNVEFIFEFDNKTVSFNFVSGTSVIGKVLQEASPFVEEKVSENSNTYTTRLNGDPTKDKASKYDGETVSVSEGNLADKNFVNGIENADKKAGVVKVTFYNGIATTKKANDHGTAVAYATRTMGGKMSDRAKADTLKSLEGTYSQGKVFAGYQAYPYYFKNGRSTLSTNAISGTFAYEAIPCDKNYVAVATYTAKPAVNTNVEADVTVSVNQTAKLQVAANDFTLNKATDNKVSYTATIQTITVGENYKVDKKTTVSVGQVYKVSQNKAIASSIIKNVKYDAKTAVFTVNAGKHITGAPAQVVINRIVSKKNVSGNKVDPVTTPVATINVIVKKTVVKPTSITLAGLYGESFANVDATTNKKQTIKVVATVDGTTALTKDVKFMAVPTVIDTVSFNTASANEAKALKAFKAASKVAKVDQNGNITIKGVVGSATIYAYTETKSGLKNKQVNLVLSNPFTVTVTKSTAKFSVVKDQVLKYNNKTAGVSANAYVVSTAKRTATLDKATGNYTKRVIYTVKGLANDRTDYVSVKVLNKEGKVVLGAITKVKTLKNGKVTGEKPYDYQVNLKDKNEYTSADDLVIVGTSQNGYQSVAHLYFK